MFTEIRSLALTRSPGDRLVIDQEWDRENRRHRYHVCIERNGIVTSYLAVAASKSEAERVFNENAASWG